MIELLVVNGCSLTQGVELDKPEDESWPAILSGRLGTELVNMAREGGSNRRMVRTTAARILDITHQRNVNPAEVLVVLVWSSADRAEFLAASAESSSSEAVRSAEWDQIGPWLRTRHNRAIRTYYDHFWSPEGQHANFIIDWSLLDAFLGSRGFQARYAFGFPEEANWSNGDDGIDLLIDRDRVFGRCEGRHESSFLGLTWDLSRGPNQHPLADSHRLFAEALESWLRSDRTLSFSRAEQDPAPPW